MGVSIVLIFAIPMMLLGAIFGNLYAFITGEKTELVLPYDEAKGIVWEYEADEDYYVNLVETRIEGNEQIFVFQDCEKSSEEDTVGLVMDLVFTDKNGNVKKFYACQDNGYAGPLIYPEEECLTAEYTPTPKYPRDYLYWTVREREYNVLIQPAEFKSETTFTVVFTPRDRTQSLWYYEYEFTVKFGYDTSDGYHMDFCEITYSPEKNELKIEKEFIYHPFDEPPMTYEEFPEYKEQQATK